MDTAQINRQPENTFLWVAQDTQSYKNILYLLLSFPLGTGYFVFLIVGLTLGISTLIIWIGVPILLVTMSIWWQLAAFERSLAIRLLGVTIAPMSYSPLMPLIQWQNVQAHLANPMTWKTFIYLLAKFVLGIFSFVMTITLLALTLAIAIFTCVIGFLTAPFVLLFLLFRGKADKDVDVKQYLVLACLGFGLVPLTFHALNSLAFVSGQFARVMLGMSDNALRLEEARVMVEQAKLRAEQAEQRRRELVLNVSHDLRTPVASIAGHVESLLLATEEGTVTPPKLHNYLTIVHNEVERLGMLVEDLLSLARAEAHELRLNITAVSASEVIEEVYQALMPLAKRERQVTLVRGAAPNLPPVQADRQRLAQVLLNLVRNAITSTPAGGIVEMSLEQPDADHLLLVVADNGIGIAEADLEHIFERFYRADSSRTRASGGFGLGLAIVHELVTAMGGSISVQSEVGKGSRFCVMLRVAKGA
jgi:signal transduction histidine kinase